MTPGERANLPRWRGRDGFVEVWFLVLFDPRTASACWLRYSLFAPVRGVVGTPRATVWAAWFEARGPRPAVAAKAIHPMRDVGGLDGQRFDIRIGSARLGHGHAAGAVTPGGRRLAWDLRFTAAELPAAREPWWLRWAPLPTRVVRASPDAVFSGTVTVDGVVRRIDAAPGLQMHLWGTRRPEELRWLYCPAFAEDSSARLEAASARLRRRVVRGIPAPWVTPVWWRTADGETALTKLRHPLSVPATGTLEICAASSRRALSARAWCAPESLVGYVYREPDGRELHVAQSDVASCEVNLFARPAARGPWRQAGRLTSRHTTVVEFHAPEPLPGIRYIPWDAEA